MASRMQNTRTLSDPHHWCLVLGLTAIDSTTMSKSTAISCHRAPDMPSAFLELFCLLSSGASGCGSPARGSPSLMGGSDASVAEDLRPICAMDGDESAML